MHCRNGSNYLAEAVTGVQRQNIPVEIIITDNGSTDSTAVLAKELGCRVVSIPHLWFSAARKVGLKEDKDSSILFSDHDEVMHEGALPRFYAEFQQDNSLQIAMAQVMDFISPELAEMAEELIRNLSENSSVAGACPVFGVEPKKSAAQ
nr:glycosyltransferase family A protein [Desulfovibrio sp.]